MGEYGSERCAENPYVVVVVVVVADEVVDEVCAGTELVAALATLSDDLPRRKSEYKGPARVADSPATLLSTLLISDAVWYASTSLIELLDVIRDRGLGGSGATLRAAVDVVVSERAEGGGRRSVAGATVVAG